METTALKSPTSTGGMAAAAATAGKEAKKSSLSLNSTPPAPEGAWRCKKERAPQVITWATPGRCSTAADPGIRDRAAMEWRPRAEVKSW
jgi:hypothetical protein